MSDIFREVDEDIRQEKYRRLWQRFGPVIIGIAVLIVVGTGGYRFWLFWEASKSAEAGDTFYEAVQLSEAENYGEAAAFYTELEGALGGYPALARLRRATDLANQEQFVEALAEFDSLSRDNSLAPALRDVASLRAGYVAVDTEGYSAVADRVERLTGADNAFRGAARELLALSSWKNGDVDTARTWLTALEEDPQTPEDVSQRAAVLAEVINASHGAPADAAIGDSQ